MPYVYSSFRNKDARETLWKFLKFKVCSFTKVIASSIVRHDAKIIETVDSFLTTIESKGLGTRLIQSD